MVKPTFESDSEAAQSCLTFATPWTVAYQAPPSMGFSRQEYWSGLSFPSPGYLPNLGMNLGLLYCGKTLYHLNHQGSRNPPSETPKILSGTLVQKGFGLISFSLRILKHKFGRSKPLWAGIRLKVDRDVFWDRWAEHGCELKLFLTEVLVLGGCWTVSHGSRRVQAEHMLLWLLSFAQASSSCS